MRSVASFLLKHFACSLAHAAVPQRTMSFIPGGGATQVCLLQAMPVKRLHRHARCVDRLCANGHTARNFDARNCLSAAPVSSERATEPSGGSTQHDQVRFAFNSLTWEWEEERHEPKGPTCELVIPTLLYVKRRVPIPVCKLF